MTVATARRLILTLPGVSEGRSYGMPSFLLGGRFFARFRDDDTVLVLQLGTITDRDVLRQLHPGAFFFTDHYRDYPAVLIRLSEVPRAMLADVLKVAWEDVSAKRTPARRQKQRRPSQ
ncbi:MAG TPA: MmcQ/YjbR family DNA-binding protein [Gemmatimonadales bacterium]|nr:MmcQ/YjbR family DNA-binding protein [Gemmatimonadales bacterium]